MCSHFETGIHLFRFSVLFSQYRSCDDTQESIFFQSWTFYVCTQSTQWTRQRFEPLRYHHLTCIEKTKSANEKGLLSQLLLVSFYNKKIWRVRVMEFLFKCSTQYCSHSLRSLLRCQVEHKKRNALSLLSIYYSLSLVWVKQAEIVLKGQVSRGMQEIKIIV